MSISIAMTTYNGATHLQEQFDSFCRQTRQPDELVVCDDDSTDATREILVAFQQQAPFRVSIYLNEINIGYTQNFNKALSNCSGNLIFLSDQDDIWHPKKIEIVENAFLANPDKHLVIHDGELVDENLVSHGVTKLGQVIAGYGKDDHLVTGALTAIHSALLPYILPIPDGMKGHDGWMHNIAGLLNTRMVLDQSLQIIRRHNSNTSSWVASSTKKINQVDVWKSQSKTVIANNYNDRVLINESSRERLERAICNNNIYSREDINKNISFLESEHRALCYRNKLAKSKFLKIKILALHMLLKGDYKFFNGCKSFLRDVAR